MGLRSYDDDSDDDVDGADGDEVISCGPEPRDSNIPFRNIFLIDYNWDPNKI